MTNELRQLDGNLRDILESIARHPKARLFRRDRDITAAAQRGEPIVRRPTEPRLIAAERELLRVHRASVALLLRQVSGACLKAASVDTVTVYFPSATTTRSQWQKSRLRTGDSFSNTIPESLFAPDSFSAQQTRSLAGLALQFEDHAHAWSHLGCSFLVEDRPSRAQSISNQVLERSWAAPDEHFLRQHLACSYSELGDYASAAHHYVRAAELLPSSTRTWCRALGHSLLASDKSTALRCDQQLRARPSPDLDAAVSVVGRELGKGASHPALKEAKATLRAIEDTLGTNSRSLLDVLFK